MDGRIDDPRLPYPVTGLSATLYCDNGRLQIDKGIARCGSSQLAFSGQCDNYLTQNIAFVLSARIEGLVLDKRLYGVLPDSLKG